MQSRTLVLIVFVSALVIMFPAWRAIEGVPTNDAAWYVQMGRTLAAGEGLTDKSLWHFLNRRDAIVGPGADFWLPLQPTLISLAYRLAPQDYRTACVPALLLIAAWAASIAYFALRQGFRPAVAGIAPFYMVVHPWVFGFALDPLAVAAFCVFAWAAVNQWAEAETHRQALVAGACLGLAGLSRNDSSVLFGAMCLITLASARRRLLPALVIGFLVVMSPYLVRNVLVFGKPMPAGGKAMWFHEYGDRYSWSREPGPEMLFKDGVQGFFQQKLEAYAEGARLTRELAPWSHWALVLLGVIVLALRRDRLATVTARACAAWLIAALVLPLLNGVRGHQHSSLIFGRIAVVPLIALLAGEGVAGVVDRVLPKRQRLLGLVLIVGVLQQLQDGLSIRVDLMVQARRAGYAYRAIGRTLRADGAKVVMTTSPWEIQLETGLPTVMVPDDPADVQKMVAERFGVTHVVLGWPFSKQVCPRSEPMPGYAWLRLVDKPLTNVEVYRVGTRDGTLNHRERTSPSGPPASRN